MKKNKRIKITTILFALFLVLLITGCKRDTSKGYKITYNKASEQELSYVISVKKNKLSIDCKGPDCSENTNKEITYSDDNINKLNEFIKNNFKDDTSIKLNEEDLETKQIEILNSIVNDEKSFELAIMDCELSSTYTIKKNEMYKVCLRKDNSILVKKVLTSSIIDIVDSYTLDFKEENKEIIRNFIERGNYNYGLSDIENIYQSIINKDESYLSKVSSKAKVMYTIADVSQDCSTPVLYIYEDKSYELIDNESIKGSGKINYDLTEFSESVSVFDENSDNTYLIRHGNEVYRVNSANEQMNMLLNNLNINLKSCIKEG